MRVVTRELDFGNGKKTASVLFTACWHLGNPAMHEEGLDWLIKHVQRTGKPWVHLGDIIEAIMPGDPRYMAGTHGETLMNEVKGAQDKVKRMAKTCWGLITGNHEGKASRKVGNITEMICSNVRDATNVQIANLSNTCYMQICCPDGICTTFLAHGGRIGTNAKAGEPERLETNKQIKLRNHLAPFHADLKGIAHGHKTIITPPILKERLSLKDGNVKKRPCPERPGWHFMAPSLFKVYDQSACDGNYAEEALYEATGLGWIEVVFNRDGTIPCIRHIIETGEIADEQVPRIIQ